MRLSFAIALFASFVPLAGCQWSQPNAMDIPFAPDGTDYRSKMDFAEVEHKYPLSPADLQKITPENVSSLSQEQIDQIYARLSAGPIPDGAYDGTIILPRGSSGTLRIAEIVGGIKGWVLNLKGIELEKFGEHLWQGKMFYRDERVLRNRIDNLDVLKKLGLIEGEPKKMAINGKDTWLLFPAKLYCGQSLLDARRESIIIDYFFTDEIPGYQENPDFLAGRRGLRVRDEIRMVRPGFYLGRAYLDRVFALNFTLYNKGVAERDGAGFLKTGRVNEDCWGGTQMRAVDTVARSVGGVPAAASTPPAEPHWVVDPADPGDDLPPRGRSLFDFLIAEKRGDALVQTVPFPFESLLQRIESQTRRDRASTGWKGVLIPLGRSLQRLAAAPDFFAYPRIVVAVDGEPSNSNGILLKDRLYLGYQEKADAIEVISYNEDAGRFEFQVVTDYRAGGTPSVAYARRALCTACHQNGGPIFSRPVWDETNANPKVAELVAAGRNDLHGIRVDRGVDVPNAIDDAKLRANRFAGEQLLWSEGCGGNDEPAIRCRGALFLAMLQYRLSGQQQFDRTSASFRDAADRVRSVSGHRWPAGLAISDPDLPNRNPLSLFEPLSKAVVIRDWTSLVHVSPVYDPLVVRPALEVWRVTDDQDTARLIIGLSELLAEPDIALLDRELFARVPTRGNGRQIHRATCRFVPSTASDRHERIEFRCQPAPDAANRSLRLDGRLVLKNDQVVGGAIDHLDIDGQSPLREIDLIGRNIGSRGAQRVAVLELTRDGRHVRGADGNALDRIELEWDRTASAAAVNVQPDFALVREAIAALVRDDVEGRFDGFANAPFRRARLVPGLFQRLGAATDAWCCLDTSGMPPPRVASSADHHPTDTATSEDRLAAPHAIFHRYCTPCHLGTERAPPNFLAGDDSAVEAKLQHCAPRIFVRLSMWRQGSEARTKTPMPPETALRRLHLSVNAWRDSDALADLTKAASERLQSETGRAPNIATLLRPGYENLRACLP